MGLVTVAVLEVALVVVFSSVSEVHFAKSIPPTPNALVFRNFLLDIALISGILLDALELQIEGWPK